VLARDVVKHLGSQAALAELVGVTQQSVSGWCVKGQPIPVKHARTVEAATGIPKEDLRPDIYPRDAGAVTASGAGVVGSGAGGGVSTPSTRAEPPEPLSGLTA